MANSVTITQTETFPLEVFSKVDQLVKIRTPSEKILKFSLSRETPKEQTALSILMDLGEILAKYGAQKDLLSMNLMLTGHEFMTYVVENIKKPFKELLKGGVEKLDEMKRVLLDPHNPMALLDPPLLVDGIVTWGRAATEKFRQYEAKYRKREIDVVVHEFALEVINWIHALPEDVRSLENIVDRSFQALNFSPSMSELSQEDLDVDCYINYSLRIAETRKTQAMLEKDLMELSKKAEEIEELEGAVVYLEEVNVQIYKDFEECLRVQEAGSLARAEELDRCFSEQEKRQQETEALHTQIYETAIERIKTIQGAYENAKVEMTAQQQQIISLCSQLRYCQAEIANLQNNQGSSCTIL